MLASENETTAVFVSAPVGLAVADKLASDAVADRVDTKDDVLIAVEEGNEADAHSETPEDGEAGWVAVCAKDRVNEAEVDEDASPETVPDPDGEAAIVEDSRAESVATDIDRVEKKDVDGDEDDCTVREGRKEVVAAEDAVGDFVPLFDKVPAEERDGDAVSDGEMRDEGLLGGDADVVRELITVVVTEAETPGVPVRDVDLVPVDDGDTVNDRAGVSVGVAIGVNDVVMMDETVADAAADTEGDIENEVLTDVVTLPLGEEVSRSEGSGLSVPLADDDVLPDHDASALVDAELNGVFDEDAELEVLRDDDGVRDSMGVSDAELVAVCDADVELLSMADTVEDPVSEFMADIDARDDTEALPVASLDDEIDTRAEGVPPALEVALRREVKLDEEVIDSVGERDARDDAALEDDGLMEIVCVRENDGDIDIEFCGDRLTGADAVIVGTTEVLVVDDSLIWALEECKRPVIDTAADFDIVTVNVPEIERELEADSVGDIDRVAMFEASGDAVRDTPPVREGLIVALPVTVRLTAGVNDSVGVTD